MSSESRDNTGARGTLVPPRERECELCGRADEWDGDAGAWRIVTEGSTPGTAHCIHEWDINGSYSPFPK